MLVVGQSLDSRWTVIGQSLDSRWTVVGKSLDSRWTFRWTVVGQSLDSRCTVFGQSLDSLWTVVGQSLAVVGSHWTFVQQLLCTPITAISLGDYIWIACESFNNSCLHTYLHSTGLIHLQFSSYRRCKIFVWWRFFLTKHEQQGSWRALQQCSHRAKPLSSNIYRGQLCCKLEERKKKNALIIQLYILD